MTDSTVFWTRFTIALILFAMTGVGLIVIFGFILLAIISLPFIFIVKLFL